MVVRKGFFWGVFFGVFYHFPKLVFLQLVFFSSNLKIDVFLGIFFCVFKNLCFLIGCFFFFEISKIGVFLSVFFWNFFNKLKNAFVLLKIYPGIFTLGVFSGQFQKWVFLFWVFFLVFFWVFFCQFQKIGVFCLVFFWVFFFCCVFLFFLVFFPVVFGCFFPKINKTPS